MTLAVALSSAILSSPGHATEDRVLVNPDSALAAVLQATPGTPLDLEAALLQARSTATSVRNAEAALHAAKGAVSRERGAFDPEIFGEIQRTSDDRPATSFFSGADVVKTKESSGLAGVRLRLPIGTELTVSANAARRESNSSFAALRPEYDASGQLTVTQPLLKGFGPSSRRDLSSAERLLDGARARYEDSIREVCAEVEEAYWDLHAAGRDFAVQSLIRDRAAAFLDEAQVRARAGLAGPNQVANARVFLAEQEQALLDRDEGLDAASDRIASLIGLRPPPGTTRFRPVDEPPQDYPNVQVDTLVAQALGKNLRLRAIRAQVESLRALARGAKWDALPAVDLFGSIGGNGLSGTPRDVVFGNDTLRVGISGGLGDTWRQVRRRDYPTWSAGIRLSVPIGFREGRGEQSRITAEAMRAEQVYVQEARALEDRVRAACRELRHGKERLRAARSGVEASQEQVRIGQVEYKSGRTTAFELVRLGADLAAAQQRYSQALVRAAKAAARLRSLTSGGYPGTAPR